MTKRIVAISFIYACTSVGWLVLAGTMVERTASQDRKLKDAVGQLWGTPQIQKAPALSCRVPADASETASSGKKFVALDASDVQVDVKLEHRRKGLLWYPTYHVKFAGEYRVVNPFGQECDMALDFLFPAKGAVYDSFHFLVDGQELQELELSSGRIRRAFTLGPGESKNVQVSYQSQGLEKWCYDFGGDVKQVKNFALVLNTDFEDIDFAEKSISPTQKQRSGKGWKLTWEYANLLSGVHIGMVMPQKLNPGPWVSKVTAAAPVSLFLFFFLLMVFTTTKRIKLHPMNYFFVGAAFFSFHLLLAYLVDHVSIHVAFWICSAVSVLLVVSYMRLVVGKRFAFLEIAVSQLVYLVLFSYTFFFKGYTGLAITILCICTLFVVMQFTGKVDWEQVFARNEKAAKPAEAAADVPTEKSSQDAG